MFLNGTPHVIIEDHAVPIEVKSGKEAAWSLTADTANLKQVQDAIADLFIVFAKINGEQFSAFIVEANTPGVSRGEEEHKMGIKGSSTRQIFFQDVKIPAENLLGEAGKGHLIAFNILNIGRLKLAAATVGGGKRLSTISVQYANQREQFKQPISSFGAIKHKLAEQAIR